jgi:prepilin-type N-terminal cleavage/methylation domain-containing protein
MLRYRRAGFTLIELMLAVAIAIIILMIAIPSMSGMSSERRLRETFERFDALTRKAQLRAVAEQRSWVLVWQPGVVMLQPDEPTPEERMDGGASSTETLTFGENESITLERLAALLPPQQTPADWIFWRSGTCEPAIVTYQGPEGSWRAQYNPLTGHGDIIEQVVK